MSTHSMAVSAYRVDAGSEFSAAGFAVGFFFAVRSMMVLTSARGLNIGTQAGVVFSLVSSGALVLAAGLQAFGQKSHPVGIILHAAPMRWVTAYIGFAGLSFAWSRSASPGSSAAYWLALVADVVLVLLVKRGTKAKSGMLGILNGFIAGACLAALVAWMMPAASDLRLGDIEYFNTNQLANLCALALLVLPLTRVRASFGGIVSYGLLSLTLLRSLSKATLVAFAVAQGYRLARDRGISRARKVMAVFAACVVLLLFSGLLENYYGEYTSAGNQAETLTGRTAIWAWTLHSAIEHPWLGNGFDAMWKVAPPFGGELFEARHAENELLQQFFAYGPAGVILLVGTYASLLRFVRKSTNRSLSLTGTAMVLFAVVRGLAEAEPFDLLLPLWLITCVAVLAATEESCSQLFDESAENQGSAGKML